MLGLHSVLEQLRNSSSAVLNDHLDFFEMSRQEDEQHFARNGDSGTSTPVDVENPSDIVEMLMQRLSSTIAMPHFISVLQHLMLVPSDEKHVHLWRLHTQQEYDNLEKMYSELEEELRKERMNVVELQNRFSDFDGRSIYSR
ncbi:unnamed protein product [Gongylonema pulchrum]|uniref:Drf_FH3 domain-containing protein n=1 Tax=Gongylonema pulchrum TaxID=637853 RepID=A0A183E219_9BILA|nr:unnamed protein product [Gongylonema pulchrum]